MKRETRDGFVSVYVEKSSLYNDVDVRKRVGGGFDWKRKWSRTRRRGQFMRYIVQRRLIGSTCD